MIVQAAGLSHFYSVKFIKMKALSFLLLLIITGTASHAQIKRTDTSRLSLPVRNSAIKLKNTTTATSTQQTTAAPITGFPTGTTQTATGIITTVPASTTQQQPSQPAQTTSYPDIIITNISFSPNTGNTYFVNYTLKNIGNTAVKKGLLYVQSYINGIPSGGGNTTALVSESDQLLNPGESIIGKNTFSTSGIAVGQNYGFGLDVNGSKINTGTSTENWTGQKFTEMNYTNNSIQGTLFIPPPPPAPADIIVTVTSIENSPTDPTLFVRINFTLKNIGETAVPSTASMTVQSSVEDTDNNPSTFLGTACCGQATGGTTIGSESIPLAPGDTRQLFFDARVAGGINFSTLPKNVLYKFKIQITGNGFADGNAANNESSHTFLLQ